MALIRWEPFSEIDSLQREMNRIFDRITPTYTSNNGSSFVPAAEMNETAEAIHLKLEIPGMNAQEIDIQVSANSVSISGERKQEIQMQREGVTRSEFRYGSFERVIPLLARVQNTNVSAEYKDGILHLNIPKAEEEKNKVVKVNIG
ncbi:MAG: Hsp20/alpha crystallin family protein [Rivularia sp. T60_A2020_040]|nr:Hsp20/alpha crystallin family protein [Rivularia sp. T60_A2020_040]